MKYKKSEATLIIIVVIAVLFLGWLININQRECNSNKDCNSESYCGSDFSCHQYPAIQKTVVQYDLVWPSIIIAIAIVAAVLIYRWDSLKIRTNRAEEKHGHEKNYNHEGYEENVSGDGPQEYYKSDIERP